MNLNVWRKRKSVLSIREHSILQLRYGLRTFDEIGKLFSISKERVRQIEAKAFRKMSLKKQND